MSATGIVLRPATRDHLLLVGRLVSEINGVSGAGTVGCSAAERLGAPDRLARMLARPDRRLYLAFDPEGACVGWIRFDINMGTREAVLSTALVPGARGRGLGRQAIALGAAACFRDRPVERVHAYVSRRNERSKRAFLGAGFRVEIASTDEPHSGGVCHFVKVRQQKGQTGGALHATDN